MSSKRTTAPAEPARIVSTPSRVVGRATADGTRRFAERHAARLATDFFRDLSGGLHASSIGIGTYLGECDAGDDARYAQAIAAAARGGINLVDTAINYRCQRSERAAGHALRELLVEGTAERDELVLCSKGGYIPLDGEPPASREAYRGYVEEHYLAPGVMRAEDVVAGGHCIAPGFLADQLERSRANLGVETIDVYYVHNPEQQLAVGDEDDFLDRMRDAFALLEDRAVDGAIGAYGVATWQGFRVGPGAKGHLSLPALAALAREVGGDDHHFRFVQLPVNLAMMEAAREPTQRLPGGRAVTLLQAAVELGISVVASASLMQAQLTRGLPAAARELFPTLTTDAQRALAFVRALPGVSCALVGMRSIEHLEENLAAGR
jgi:aryl-alcohol dehydrogenase-like predicted oxidoreductase